MSKRPRIVVIGSCIADCSVQVPRLPSLGETIIGQGLTVSLGGKGANQAVALARLGAQVWIVGCVGNDESGRRFKALFDQEGVDASHLREHELYPTGMGIPLVLPDGGNAIVVAPAAAMSLTASDVSAASGLLRGADALLLQLEGSEESVREAVSMARRAGVTVFLNPAPILPFAVAAVSGADVVIPNRSEAEELIGNHVTVEGAVGACRALRRLGPQAAIITLGSEGAAMSSDEFEGIVPASRVSAIDTTGAGDAFCAAVTYQRSSGHDWASSVRFANACGALATLTAGAGPAMPSKATVETFIAVSN